MPKVIDDHRERNFRSSISRRTTKTPTGYLMARLGISRTTAAKYLRDPLTMKIGDLVQLGLNDQELLEVIR